MLQMILKAHTLIHKDSTRETEREEKREREEHLFVNPSSPKNERI